MKKIHQANKELKDKVSFFPWSDHLFSWIKWQLCCTIKLKRTNSFIRSLSKIKHSTQFSWPSFCWVSSNKRRGLALHFCKDRYKLIYKVILVAYMDLQPLRQPLAQIIPHHFSNNWWLTYRIKFLGPAIKARPLLLYCHKNNVQSLIVW